jgi:hypothetical protein
VEGQHIRIDADERVRERQVGWASWKTKSMLIRDTWSGKRKWPYWHSDLIEQGDRPSRCFPNAGFGIEVSDDVDAECAPAQASIALRTVGGNVASQ